jgi:hypothetical protein
MASFSSAIGHRPTFPSAIGHRPTANGQRFLRPSAIVSFGHGL